MAWCAQDGSTTISHMNESRISELRQDLGWTQERLAAESGVGIRTIQRLEAGHDASLDTLSLVAGALRVSVRELFASLDGQEFSDRVESMESRTQGQQAARDNVTRAWRWLYIGIGIVVTLFSFTTGQYGLPLLVSYWVGGFIILRSLGTLVFEPRLDERYPLSRSRRQLKAERARPKESSAVENAAERGL
jgi:transcriptional regulator with XRE-family HTH domain